jgi:hypothetical protein
MEEQKIYSVMVVGKQTPTKFYDRYQEALNEAKRLASIERKTTYVLLAVIRCDFTDVTITPL